MKGFYVEFSDAMNIEKFLKDLGFARASKTGMTG
jgi:hypothetical protein